MKTNNSLFTNFTHKNYYNILIVTNQVDHQNFLFNELSPQYNLSFSTCGREAISIINTQIPHLIISDLKSSDLDGFDLCQYSKNNAKSSHIPILIIVNEASLNLKLKGLDYGVDDFISKPFHSDLIRKRVFNLIKNNEIKINYLSEQKGFSLPSKTISHQNFMSEVQKVFTQEIKNTHFNVELLAHKLYMSISTLRRRLKEFSKDSPAKLIRDLRLKKAAELLKDTDLNIYQISEEIGISDPNNFSRLFKITYRQNPTQYRESRKRISSLVC